LARFEFESGTILFYFSFTFVSFGESCLLISWCAGGRCGMKYSDKDCGRSRRPGAEDRDGRTGQVLGGRTIERSGDTVCDRHCVHVETRRESFLVVP
jgi:hypothetical protein